MDREMMKALEADGEYLLQMTGEDHGPYFLEEGAAEITLEEQKWFSRLRRVLRDMPETVEIQVHPNSIQMNRAGAVSAAFEKHGDADNAESLDFFVAERVYPCSESI